MSNLRVMLWANCQHYKNCVQIAHKIWNWPAAGYNMFAEVRIYFPACNTLVKSSLSMKWACSSVGCFGFKEHGVHFSERLLGAAWYTLMWRLDNEVKLLREEEHKSEFRCRVETICFRCCDRTAFYAHFNETKQLSQWMHSIALFALHP